MTQTIFAALGPDGQPYEVPQDAPFSTHSVLVTSEEEAAWSFVPMGERAPFEVTHPAGALRLYSDADLERYGIFKLTVEAAPAGCQLGASDLLVDEAGQITVTPVWEPAPVPPVVSRMQAKLALLAAGQLDLVEAAIAGASRTVQIYWAEVSELHRDHPVLGGMAAELGWSEANVDDLFRTAAAIR